MDKSNDKGQRKKTADEIIAFIEGKIAKTDDEWLEYGDFVNEWLKDRDVSEEEKWKYRLSGFAEMLSMICAGILHKRSREK